MLLLELLLILQTECFLSSKVTRAAPPAVVADDDDPHATTRGHLNDSAPTPPKIKATASSPRGDGEQTASCPPVDSSRFF